jgi:hypothetical protein
MKRRKPKAQRKEELVRIRLTDEQKELFVNSATDAGLDVSSWLRSLGLREIKRQVGGKGEE